MLSRFDFRVLDSGNCYVTGILQCNATVVLYRPMATSTILSDNIQRPSAVWSTSRRQAAACSQQQVDVSWQW